MGSPRSFMRWRAFTVLPLLVTAWQKRENENETRCQKMKDLGGEMEVLCAVEAFARTPNRYPNIFMFG
jgi:hypothetical protein